MLRFVASLSLEAEATPTLEDILLLEMLPQLCAELKHSQQNPNGT